MRKGKFVLRGRKFGVFRATSCVTLKYAEAFTMFGKTGAQWVPPGLSTESAIVVTGPARQIHPPNHAWTYGEAICVEISDFVSECMGSKRYIPMFCSCGCGTVLLARNNKRMHKMIRAGYICLEHGCYQRERRKYLSVIHKENWIVDYMPRAVWARVRGFHYD